MTTNELIKIYRQIVAEAAEIVSGGGLNSETHCGLIRAATLVEAELIRRNEWRGVFFAANTWD